MAITNIANGGTELAHIPVRKIGVDDLYAALREGYADFMKKRGDVVFIIFLYPVIALLIAVAVAGNGFLPLLFPLMAGFILLGPIVATGFYELARRREAGLDSRWRHFLDIRKSPSYAGIALVSLLLFGIFITWLICAGLIYRAFFDWHMADSFATFAANILTTQQGLAVIIIGNLVGLVFALIALAISFVSLPILVDKHIDAATAIRTSVAAFNANRAVVLRWGIIVAMLLIIGAIPLLIGLVVVLPILGYATWHLYTKIVVRN